MADNGKKVRDIIEKELGVERDKMTDEASFIEDLGADSLEIFDEARLVGHLVSLDAELLLDDVTDLLGIVGHGTWLLLGEERGKEIGRAHV